jgi:hypothetical protein
MPKKKEPESFEKTEYSGGDDFVYERFAAIKQIVSDKVSEQPNVGCHVTVMGDKLKLVYHAYEMHAPSRMPAIQHLAKMSLDEMLRHIKKEYKSRTGKVLDMTEDRSAASSTMEKVSLNERFHYAEWRCFNLK